jgi:hypothetical protein
VPQQWATVVRMARRKDPYLIVPLIYGGIKDCMYFGIYLAMTSVEGKGMFRSHKIPSERINVHFASIITEIRIKIH